ncbi:MAG TPA: cobalamin-binding protein [Desulfobacteraceae bacterium]|nr:cobalamin-binding protein [Desulfobacteraceae bacterium]HPJ66576.1 cobalamin-binding protein [Desulfobacteraceae bacterium]HPQ28812.1 cobalamin-binding protein [Desulfobacteraceae bacterium]
MLLKNIKLYRYKFGAVVLQAMLGLFVLFDAQLFARDVIDQLGRKITLPQSPQRVVSLAPNITEIIFALSLEHRLVGVTLFSDYPAEAAKIPKVGSYVCLDLEKIIALRPDLCIAVKDGNPKETVDRLNSMDVAVYAVDPRNLYSVMDSILEIGRLLFAEQKAINLVHDMNRRIEAVKAKVAETSYRPGVFCQIGASPIVSVGSGTIINELIVTAGGRNLSQGPVAYPRFNREQVLALSPDVLIVTSMERELVFEDIKAEWNRWPDLPAVREQKIFLVDSDLCDRAGPRLIEGLELFLEMIHPESIENSR